MGDPRYPLTKQIIKAILPQGLFWKPKPGGTLDKIYDVIGEVFDDVINEASELINLRIPLKTKWLEDLEKEYGVISLSAPKDLFSEDERRKYLDALVFATRGNASKDYIQDRLVRAGFPVTVIANQNPVKNPADYLLSGYNMCCIDQDTVDASEGVSYCGNPQAVCGFSGGELFVDGVTNYDLPQDPDTWSYVFFVGGVVRGGLLLDDWNMELPHVNFWQPNNNTYRLKDKSTKNTGTQSLLVRDQVNTEEQELYPDINDASLVAALRMYDLQQDLGSSKEEDHEPLLEDYNMKDAGVTYWPAIGGATRSKTSGGGIPNALISSDNLLVEPTEAWTSGVRRNELTIGEKYRLRMWLRVKNDILPAVVNGDQIVYDSTGNGYGTLTWIDIDKTFIAESVNLDFVAADDHDFLEGFQIDEVILHKKIETEILKDADMELAGTDNWESFGGATVDKESVNYPYFGNQCLEITINGVINSGVRQDCLTIGKTYYVCAYATVGYGEESGKTALKCGNTIVAESTTTAYEYTKFEGVFLAESTFLELICTEASIAYVMMYWDNIILAEVAINEVKNIAPINLFTDGDMEKTGYSDWIEINNPTLSKYSSDSYIGDQCLKVLYNGTSNPGVTQAVRTEVGNAYLIVCASKGDGVCDRNITVGSTVIKQWGSSADWDMVTVPYLEQTAVNEIKFICEGDSVAEYSLFDNIKVIPLYNLNNIIPYYPSTFNKILDGNCEQEGTYFWTAVNNATLLKSTANKYSGLRGLLIAYDDTSEHGVKQSCLDIGKQYYVSVKLKRAEIVSGMTPAVFNNTELLWAGDNTDDDWQNVEILFTATHEDLVVKALSANDTLYLDAFFCIEIDPVNNDAINIIDPSGRTLDFPGDTEHVDCNKIGRYLDDHWTIEFVAVFDGVSCTILHRGTLTKQWLISVDSTGYIKVEGTSGSVVGSTVVLNNILYQEGPRHVVITHDTVDTRIYIDGVLDNTGSISCTAQPTGVTKIGQSAYYDNFDGKITYVSMYNVKHSADWVKTKWNEWLNVLWSGTVNREKKSGIQQVSNDIELNNKKLRAELWLDGNNANSAQWYSSGREGFTLGIDGSGTDPSTGLNSEFSSDKGVMFQSGKYYKANDTSFCDIDAEDFIIHFLIYTDSYGEIFRKYSTNGYLIKTLSDLKIEFTFYDSGSPTSKQSTSSLPSNTWCFVTIAVSKSGGYIQMFCNGSSILTSTSLPSYTSLSNTENISIGMNDITYVSFISIWKEDSWFSSLLSDSFFEDIYNKYLTKYRPDFWSKEIWNQDNKLFPTGGPYVEQLVDETDIPKYITQPGLKNIVDDNEITIDGITETPVLCYRGNDAVEYYSNWFPYKQSQLYSLTEYGSGDDVEYDQYTDLLNEDRCVRYKAGGKVHRCTIASFANLDLHDFIIEVVMKTGAASDTFCKKQPTTVGYQIKYSLSSERLQASLSDGVTTETVSSEYNSVKANTWIHGLIIIKRNKGTGTQEGKIYINGEPSSSVDISGLGSLTNSGNFIFQGSASDNCIALYRMWSRYDWIDDVQQDELAAKLYNNYTTGGLEFPSPIPLKAYSWGDNKGTIPIIMLRDYLSGEWHKLWRGSTRDVKQTILETIQNGISGIRMYPKYEYLGESNFDDISSPQTIDYIDLDKRKRRMFYHLLAQSKPLSSWAALLINWV